MDSKNFKKTSAKNRIKNLPKSYYLMNFSSLIILYFLLSSLVSHAAENLLVNRAESKAENQVESRDRQVDQVALHSKNLAIQKLTQLVKKYKNSREESNLLMSLAEAYQGSAEIEFRITYAHAHQRKITPNLATYQTILKNQIGV